MSLSAICLILLPTLLTPVIATCYWPNGDTDNNYTPCPNSKSCCLKGEACLSNGLCYGATLNIAYRGACADKSWPAQDCPHVCLDSIPDHWANLYSCPNSSTNVFTCGYAGWATDVCSANLGQWQWVSGDVEVAKNGNPSPSASGSASTQLDIITTTSSVSGVSTGTPRGTITGDIVTTTGSATATATGTGTNTPKSDASISAMTLGAGLGVGLGVPLLVVSGLLIFFIRMRRRAPAPPAPPVSEKPYPGAVYYPGPAEIATQRHNMATELEGSRHDLPDRPELYGS
ncbi:uncharacterized protein NFIA_058090 [Aspergillus fischeri NRRL 181]|uniref:Mid2 domain-containing protein n=1 Tax=Neosartorya fischeri (strain ATCC 1020 / DSM 3700 / CBS 544.65 / FGSC A1164 / JCM 1740 / NRRL 181 / WB 181) TaxID=331117 RepID=A1DNT8_NEOFI|nr:conserved hypothetical protein [Aspergillus fischeri NRRL 181]EAW16459.1 conserved hypothetical protein [Aspergillus fischeri NRRL 181]KAG2024273.1 hypothetical protein GB937_003924 [Aspergillus fischeri]